jgi:uncharacterized membrane protein
MIGTKSFTIPAEGKMVGVIASVLTFGTLALAAVVAVAYFLNLTVEVLVSLCAHIATLYNHSDSAVQLLMVCIAGYLLLKVFHLVKRSLFNR